MVGIDIPMPENCCDCPCNDHDYMCNLTDAVFSDTDDFDYCFERLPDCPLVDLQKPAEAIEAEKTIERMRENLNRIRKVLKVLNE